MRGPTAFFIFSEEKREQTRAECVAATEPGAKISVAVIAKAIGEKWRALTDAEKAEYQERAAQRTRDLAESAAAEAENEAGEGAEGTEDGSPGKEGEQKAAEQDTNPNLLGFPLSLVKRIMCLDPEVMRISGDGLKAVAKAAELMLADMAARSCSVAQGQKRRTIKLCDVDQTVRRDRRLVEVGLKDVLAEDMFKEGKAPLRDAANHGNAAAGRDGPEGEQTPAAQKAAPGRKKAKESVDVGRPITDFFNR